MRNHCPNERETTPVKKRICTIIFALLTAFLLVGCKAKDSEPNPEINPISQNESKPILLESFLAKLQKHLHILSKNAVNMEQICVFHQLMQVLVLSPCVLL